MLYKDFPTKLSVRQCRKVLKEAGYEIKSRDLKQALRNFHKVDLLKYDTETGLVGPVKPLGQETLNIYQHPTD